MDVVTLGMAKAAAKRIAKTQGRALRMATLSDSLMSYSEGVPTYMELLSNQRLQFADPNGGSRNVFSYPGKDTAYLKTQQGNVLGLTVKPDACLVQGGTNDVIATVPTATIMANLTSMYDALEGAGIRPIITTIPPLGGSYQYLALKPAARQLNIALRRHAALTGRMIVDPYTTLVEPTTGSYQTAYDSGDNVHPAQAGIKAWAQHIVDRLASGLGPVDLTLLERTNDSNSLYQSLRLNTGGGNWGGANAGLAVDMGATTVQTGYTPSLVADGSIAGINWQRFTVSGATAAQGVYQQTGQTVAPGDLIVAAIRYRSGQDSGGNKALAYMRTYVSGGAEAGNFQMLGPIGVSRAITDGIGLTVFRVPAGANRAQLNLQIPQTNGTYDFAQPTIYNLTALGIA